MENTISNFRSGRTILLLIILFLAISAFLFKTNAQTGFGTLKGQVTNKETGTSLAYANVVIEINGTIKAGVSTDMNGYFSISSLTPGKYDLKASYIGYTTISITGIVINANGITHYDVKLNPSVELKPIDIVAYREPLVDVDEVSGEIFTAQEIRKAPVRDIQSFINMTPSVINGSVQGQRSDANTVYVDGVKVRGDYNIPLSSIQEIQTLTNGIPAEYGDLLGGVVIITTKSPLQTSGGF